MTMATESGTICIDTIPGKPGQDDRQRITILKNFGDTARRINVGSFFGEPTGGLEGIEDGITGSVTFMEVQGKRGTYFKPVSFEPATLPAFRPATMAGYLAVDERRASNGNRYAAAYILPDKDAPAIQLSGVFNPELIERMLETDPTQTVVLEYCESNGFIEPLDVITK